MTEPGSLYTHAGGWHLDTGGKSLVDSQTTLSLLRTARPDLERRFGVVELVLFGSVARDDADESSDVDILVKFDTPATSARYFGVQFHLEDLLGLPVDLVTDAALRPELRPFVERDAVRV